MYENERIDELLEEGRRTTDPDERREIYHEIMRQTLAEDYVHIPLVWLNTIVGVRDRVEGFEPSPQGYFHLVSDERNVTIN
jgi:peptide/nickel transport system substrate-binding protein